MQGFQLQMKTETSNPGQVSHRALSAIKESDNEENSNMIESVINGRSPATIRQRISEVTTHNKTTDYIATV